MNASSEARLINRRKMHSTRMCSIFIVHTNSAKCFAKRIVDIRQSRIYAKRRENFHKKQNDSLNSNTIHSHVVHPKPDYATRNKLVLNPIIRDLRDFQELMPVKPKKTNAITYTPLETAIIRNTDVSVEPDVYIHDMHNPHYFFGEPLQWNVNSIINTLQSIDIALDREVFHILIVCATNGYSDDERGGSIRHMCSLLACALMEDVKLNDRSLVLYLSPIDGDPYRPMPKSICYNIIAMQIRNLITLRGLNAITYPIDRTSREYSVSNDQYNASSVIPFSIEYPFRDYKCSRYVMFGIVGKNTDIY